MAAPEHTPTEADDIAAAERHIVAAYARAKRLEEEAAAIKAEAKKQAETIYNEYGLASLQGPEGVVTIASRLGSKRLDKKLVANLLTPEQLEACHVVGKPSLQVAFKAREVR